MAVVTFNVPCKKPRARTITMAQKTGNVAYFQIGNERIKFVLQHGHDGKPDSLVHYASGMVFGRLNGPKLEHAVSRGSYSSPLNDRAAAETLIARAVAGLGAETVLQKLANVPAINH